MYQRQLPVDTLAQLVHREWRWISVLLRNGVDHYQLAFILKALVVAHPDYQSSIPMVVSDLTACIQERLSATAA